MTLDLSRIPHLEARKTASELFRKRGPIAERLEEARVSLDAMIDAERDRLDAEVNTKMAAFEAEAKTKFPLAVALQSEVDALDQQIEALGQAWDILWDGEVSRCIMTDLPMIEDDEIMEVDGEDALRALLPPATSEAAPVSEAA